MSSLGTESRNNSQTVETQNSLLAVLEGDCIERLKQLPPESVQCCVTSPPYWGLRDYGHSGQIGLEKTPQEYVERLLAVFREVRRVLRADGTLWLNLGDSYASFRDGKATPDSARGESVGTLVPKGAASNRMAATFAGTRIKHKDLVGIPWSVAFALRNDGWYLRSDIIWHKPNPMPESVTDRPTKAHEYIFLLSKSQRYYYDHSAIKEPALEESANRYKYAFTGRPDEVVVCPEDSQGQRYAPKGMREYTPERNKRTVWTVNTSPYDDAHFATYPPDLIKPCILAGSKPGDTILDPFGGSGTTGMVALELGRKAVLIELNPDYIPLKPFQPVGDCLRTAEPVAAL